MKNITVLGIDLAKDVFHPSSNMFPEIPVLSNGRLLRVYLSNLQNISQDDTFNE